MFLREFWRVFSHSFSFCFLPFCVSTTGKRGDSLQMFLREFWRVFSLSFSFCFFPFYVSTTGKRRDSLQMFLQEFWRFFSLSFSFCFFPFCVSTTGKRGDCLQMFLREFWRVFSPCFLPQSALAQSHCAPSNMSAETNLRRKNPSTKSHSNINRGAKKEAESALGSKMIERHMSKK